MPGRPIKCNAECKATLPFVAIQRNDPLPIKAGY